MTVAATAPVAAATVDLIVGRECSNLCIFVVGPPVPPPLGEPSSLSAPNCWHATGMVNCLLLLPLLVAASSRDEGRGQSFSESFDTLLDLTARV